MTVTPSFCLHSSQYHFPFGGAFNPFAGFFGTSNAGGFGFNFRDPNEVFREFFASDPFGDFADMTRQSGGNQGQSNSGGTGQPGAYSNSGGAMFMDPFSMLSGAFPGMSTMSSVQMSSSGGPNVKRISTSVKVVNGKKIETKR